jgi:Uma2 family endonuclease
MALPAFSDDQAHGPAADPAADDVRLPVDAHRFTVEEYLRLAVTGDPTWDQTELIDGVVYERNPQYDRHGRWVWEIAQVVQRAFPADQLRIGVTVRLGATTAVEPDVVVFTPAPGHDPDAPISGSKVKLAVEVSVSTLRRDTVLKARAYGAAGVPVYWVVDPNPEDPYLLVYTEPFEKGYSRTRRIALPDGVDGLDVADALRG